MFEFDINQHEIYLMTFITMYVWALTKFFNLLLKNVWTPAPRPNSKTNIMYYVHYRCDVRNKFFLP